RNVFRCEIKKSRSPLYRFVFNLRNIGVAFDGSDAKFLEYMRQKGLNFVGFDGESTVTAFFLGSLRRQMQVDVGEP
ncbi:MAG: hypothetical protein LC800_01720, partial [Acidobacteria bacterium]|nr:hypothetical protein [Acidobacteriota bacterium]